MANLFLHHFITIYILTINCINAYEVSISPRAARVIEGGSIRLVLKTDPPMPFTTCQVVTSKNIVIQNNETTDMIHILDEAHSDGMQWISLGECGLMIFGTSKYSEGTWSLTGRINDNEYTFGTRVTIIDRPSSSSVVSPTLGSHTDIDCNAASPTRPTYCIIMDNNGELVTDSCTMRLDPVKQEHVGNWTCRIGLMGSLEEIIHVVELNLKPNDRVVGYSTKTESTIILRCTLENSNLAISWCRATGPSGKQMMLTEGLAANRYSSFGTDIQKKQCGFEIALPLDPSLDIGRWRIDLGRSVDDFSGCFFSLPDTESTIVPVPKVADQNIFVIPRSLFQLKCSVPWPIRYCYVRRPDGEIIPYLDGASSRLQTAGFCQIAIRNVSETWSGRWACVVSSQIDGLEDISFYTNVHVMNELIIPDEKRVRSYMGKTAILTCKSPTRHPMRYCRFISPSGKGFSVHPDSQTNSKYVYWGKGLEYGECGMQIKIIQKEDEGKWTCATSFSSNLPTENVNVMYVGGPGEPGVAMIIGMSIGGIMVATAVITLLIYHCNRRRKDEVTVNRSTTAYSSDDNLSL